MDLEEWIEWSWSGVYTFVCYILNLSHFFSPYFLLHFFVVVVVAYAGGLFLLLFETRKKNRFRTNKSKWITSFSDLSSYKTPTTQFRRGAKANQASKQQSFTLLTCFLPSVYTHRDLFTTYFTANQTTRTNQFQSELCNSNIGTFQIWDRKRKQVDKILCGGRDHFFWGTEVDKGEGRFKGWVHTPKKVSLVNLSLPTFSKH